jgi:KDO2-lipid IV(A) lauroyltransferase
MAAARGLGDLLYRFDRRHRGVAERNLRLAIGGPPQEIRRLARASFVYLAEVGAEFLLLPRIFGRGGAPFLERCRVEGFEALEPFRAKGRGVLFVTGHVGSFEVIGAAGSLLGYPLRAIARRFKNPLLDREVRRVREAWGQRILPRRGGLRALVEALRRGECAGFLLDQNERKRPIFLPVFGRIAACDRSVAALARRLDLPVAVVYCVREGPGWRYRMVLEEVLLSERGVDPDEADRDLTLRVQQSLERIVLRHPDRYLWLHDRYRTRPPEERLGVEGAPSAAAASSAAPGT